MGKYLDLIRQHERTQPDEAVRPQPAIDQASTVNPGDSIEWHRADGSLHRGVVDLVHVDAMGSSWAFVTIGQSWAAVNLRYTAVATDVTGPCGGID